MRIGFTGTQKGMTEHQKSEVKRILASYEADVTQIHHGGCVGADAQFHEICSTFGRTSFIPIVHPASGVSPSKVAKLEPPDATYLPAKPALVRNRIIVDSSDVMIATPGQDYEVLRSGTWATIRYARLKYAAEQGKAIHIVFP